MSDESVVQTPVTSPEPSAAPAAESKPVENAEKPVEKAVPEKPATEEKSDQQKAAEKAARKLKLKVDGVEEEMSEEDVIRLAQLSKSSSRRFQEAAKYRKQAEQFIEMLKSDPLSVMSHPDINVDVRKFAEDYLIKIIEKEQLSPEAQKLQEAEEKLKKYEEEQKKAKEREEQEMFEKARVQYVKEYEEKIQTALAAEKLPKTPYTVQRMAEYLKLALDNKMEVEPSEVAVLVKKDYMSDIMSLFGESDGDKLLEFLGDGVANKIRKADLKRWESQQAAKKAPVEEPKQVEVVEKKEQERQYKNIHEWREEMEKKLRG